MKLQGVFMIIPLLAVVANGSTIPSTDSYNVQQLEKRGDNDPDINESAVEELKAKLMEKYEAQKKAHSDLFAEYSVMVEEHEKLRKQKTQVNIDLQNEIDKGKEKESVELFNSLQVGHMPQDFFDKDKTNGPEESTSSLEDPYGLKHTVAEDGKEGLVESSGSFGTPYEHQHSIAKDGLEEIEQSNQEPLKIQDEITIRDSSNKKLPEKQARAAAQSSGIPRVKMVNLNPILSKLKMPRDYSHGTKTGAKQANDDQQRVAEPIRKKHWLKRV
ncbi:hypothetical protein BASA50_007594 [Batrachochytrium salamandrivorans]|uniref:Secreted protein n=1 Tax=Batrachochytrium salamandrivorans TaxID=1357716 RepID=A0ABQ8F6L7_9FUNG|nr:hypothetical protein BASA50_007594 [Batrachochytrium salamandrivorans]